MNKVLITGINGGAGSYLAEYIAKNFPEREIWGTARVGQLNKNLAYLKSNLKMLTCDLCDFSATFKAIRAAKPDVIFHFASLANVRDSFENPIAYINNNINVTLNLLEAIRTIKTIEDYDPIIMVCSTAECYSNQTTNDPIDENFPLQPNNPYAVSKMAQDNLATVYYKSFGLRIIKTRMFTYFNARRADLFASSFAKQIIDIELGKKEILEHGNLNSVRTIIDVRDAVEAYWKCIERGRVGETYNIGGSEPISVGGVLELLKSKAKCEIISREAKHLLRPQDISYQIPNTDKFKAHTGWGPKYSLNESLDFFLEEVRKNYV